MTSAGQRHDSLAFVPLMGRLAVARRGPGRPRTGPGRVLGDKAYSSTAIRGGRPPAFDTVAYKQRNTVERAFCQLRQHRAAATRYDKRDYVWRGTESPR